MKLRNADNGRPDILGNRPALDPVVELSAVKMWRDKLGYLSVIAGAAAIAAALPQNVLANNNDNPVSPQPSQRLTELASKITASCSKPELLRRQTGYALPSQKGELNMLELVAGGDNCPGNPIPPGVYTAASPFTDSGNTNEANTTVSFVQAGCMEYSQTAGPDHIYSFKIGARGASPQIVVNAPGHDASIYILNGATGAMCPTGTANEVTNCLVGSDATVSGSETLNASKMGVLPLNVPLYLFIDSFYTSSNALSRGAYTVTMRDVTVVGDTAPPENDAPIDMNADGKSDFVVIRNTGGGMSGQATWLTAYQDGDPTLPTDWGIATDEFVPGDYDGDGKDDFAIFRPGTVGRFYIVQSTNGVMRVEDFGTTGDDATVVGDYDGDGEDDIAVYRSGATEGAQSYWYYRPRHQAVFTRVEWGEGGDSPAPGDYDGDGKNDFVVQRADSNGVNGRFYVRMAAGAQFSDIFGLKSDTVVPGDYDGDGKTDIAVARDDDGLIRWDFKPSGSPTTPVVTDTWGETDDWIVQADYDGDGKTEYAVWRPGNPGVFYIMTVGTRNITTRNWGAIGDYPVAAFNSH